MKSKINGSNKKNSKINSSNNKSYFNVNMKCVAYINEIKAEKARKVGEDDKVRISLSVLHGNAQKPKKEFYSLLIATEASKEILGLVWSDINNPTKYVLGSFVVSKSDSRPFMFESGKKQGLLGVTHFGTLLEIKLLKVDGEQVYAQEKMAS